MADQFQTLTAKQFVEADEDLVILKQLVAYVSNQCNRMLDGCENKDIRREYNMLLQANASMFERVNSVLSILRENKQ